MEVPTANPLLLRPKDAALLYREVCIFLALVCTLSLFDVFADKRKMMLKNKEHKRHVVPLNGFI